MLPPRATLFLINPSGARSACMQLRLTWILRCYSATTLGQAGTTPMKRFGAFLQSTGLSDSKVAFTSETTKLHPLIVCLLCRKPLRGTVGLGLL